MAMGQIGQSLALYGFHAGICTVTAGAGGHPLDLDSRRAVYTFSYNANLAHNDSLSSLYTRVQQFILYQRRYLASSASAALTPSTAALVIPPA